MNLFGSRKLDKREKRCCGFCGGGLLKLSFELLSCDKCHVLYDQHDMRIYMVTTERSYSARWKEVPAGTLVVLEKFSWGVTEMDS